MTHTPYDLEKALAGEEVVLRNGSWAKVVWFDPEIDYDYDCCETIVVQDSSGSLHLNWAGGANYESKSYDIMGMWESPPKMLTFGSLTFPSALTEPPEYGTVYYYMSPHGLSKETWENTPYDNSQLESGLVYASESQAAEAEAALLKIRRGEF